MTGAKILYDNMQKGGSLPAERQTLLDVLVAKDLVEQKCISVLLLPNNHQFAEFLAKPEGLTPNVQISLRRGILSLVPTQAHADDETHRLELRRGQRQRAKERKEARRTSSCRRSSAVPRSTEQSPRPGWPRFSEEAHRR